MNNLSKGKLLEVQKRLKALGFDSGPLDGQPGPRTSKAIIAFKKSIGFKARDYIGPLTFQALFDEPKKTSPDIPPWIDQALKVKGLHERRNYSVLKNWLFKSWAWVDPRSIPWCGAFVGTCIKKWKPSVTTPANSLGARNWNKFGFSVHPDQTGKPIPFGAILTFWRGSRNGWQGHVGFYYGKDATHYHVLGGNQSNAVTISRIAKTRLLDARWPNEYRLGSYAVMPTEKNISITTNEA